MFAMKDGEEEVKQYALVPRDAAVVALTNLLIVMTGRNPPPTGVESVVDAMIEAARSGLEPWPAEEPIKKSKGGA